MSERAFTMGLVMIVKDGAHLLYRILDKLKPNGELYSDRKPKFDQVVILDTGSTDGTVEMLKTQYPWVEVHETTWEFDFSIARNQALSHLTTDVWMWLDADDTFTDDALDRWFQIAEKLWSKRNEVDHPVYAMIPYIYEVDKNDLPVIVHYRERILLGRDWEWREPLHEVCFYKLAGGGNFEAFNDCPVVHRPIGDDVAGVAGERNWKILMHHYINGDRSDRTLYYIGRMANQRCQFEFTLQVAPLLLERKPGGYYEYEAAMCSGEAYAQIYRRDKIAEYKTKALEYFEQAKRYEPQRNDARSKICDLHVYDRSAEEALKEALAMNENMPATVATTLPQFYGKYKYSILAMIYFRLIGNAWLAMRNHFMAMDCPKPHITTFDLEPLLRAYLRDHDVGVIYADTKYVNQAMGLRKYLLQKGVFREVYVFDNPHCIAYASKFYFHFSEKNDTLYQEDGHPRLRKFLVTPHELESIDKPFGYEDVMSLPASPSELEETLDVLLQDTAAVFAVSIEGGLEQVMALRTDKAVVSFTTDAMDAMVAYEEQQPTMVNKLRFFVNSMGYLLGISGWVDTISTLYMDNRGILRSMSLDDCEMVMSSQVPGLTEADSGVKFRMEAVPKPSKTIMIVAPGIEDWDGATPRRWGIGASESCVIYMAEQMVRRGYQVTVYNTTFKSKVVAGVAYVNMTLCLDDGTQCDLFVASRIPEALTTRRGKLQVLWMHDIAEAYAHRMNNKQVIDRFVYISEWQWSKALKQNFKASKGVFIPNGLVNWPDYRQSRVPGRSVWVSQPERGIDNLHLMWQKHPELFTDLWVVYGFYNLLNYRSGNIGMNEDSFYDTCRYKYALRQMKAKIVGRVPHSCVQMLAQTAERWVYPSVFPETFCVAGLEALHNGVQCYYTNNGGTAETLDRAQIDVEEGLFTSHVPPPRRVRMVTPTHTSFDFDTDGERWATTIKDNAGINRDIGFSDPYYYWERVADEWEALLNGNGN